MFYISDAYIFTEHNFPMVVSFLSARCEKVYFS